MESIIDVRLKSLQKSTFYIIQFQFLEKDIMPYTIEGLGEVSEHTKDALWPVQTPKPQRSKQKHIVLYTYFCRSRTGSYSKTNFFHSNAV